MVVSLRTGIVSSSMILSSSERAGTGDLALSETGKWKLALAFALGSFAGNVRSNAPDTIYDSLA
jgi:hypothetical protein